MGRLRSHIWPRGMKTVLEYLRCINKTSDNPVPNDQGWMRFADDVIAVQVTRLARKQQLNIRINSKELFEAYGNSTFMEK